MKNKIILTRLQGNYKVGLEEFSNIVCLGSSGLSFHTSYLFFDVTICIVFNSCYGITPSACCPHETHRQSKFLSHLEIHVLLQNGIVGELCKGIDGDGWFQIDVAAPSLTSTWLLGLWKLALLSFLHFSRIQLTINQSIIFYLFFAAARNITYIIPVNIIECRFDEQRLIWRYVFRPSSEQTPSWEQSPLKV